MSDRAETIAAVLAEHHADVVFDCRCGWRGDGFGDRWRAHVAAELDRALPRYEQVGWASEVVEGHRVETNRRRASVSRAWSEHAMTRSLAWNVVA